MLQTERSARRLARLRLAPLRSLRALADPRRAAQRTTRLISAVLRGAMVRCELPALGCSVCSGREHDSSDAHDYRVPVRWQRQSLGSISLRSTAPQWREARPLVAALVEPLALLVALHGAPPTAHALQGVILTPQRLHDLNNVANAITLQMGVVHSLLQRGRAAEAALFVERCVGQADRLAALLIELRHR